MRHVQLVSVQFVTGYMYFYVRSIRVPLSPVANYSQSVKGSNLHFRVSKY